MFNSRLTVAIHVLCLLAYERSGQPVTSDYIAGSVNTNPVVIRRLLAALRKAGVVRSQSGGSGGWMLEKKPSKISLLDVHRLVNPEEVFALHNKQPNPRCPIGRNIQQNIGDYYRRARKGMEKELGKTSIADVLADTLGMNMKA